MSWKGIKHRDWNKTELGTVKHKPCLLDIIQLVENKDIGPLAGVLPISLL